MATLSVVICTKRAKIIFARQFVQMTRRELEEYVVQFSRNIDSCKEITHLESDKVRYLFIPIDTFYLILITSKNSNIIEDTEILKLIYRLIQDVCNTVDYNAILDKAYELMLGVDDIVCLGYRSGANIAQIKQYLLMESLEEKEFRRKKLEQEQKVQKELYEKGKEFDRLKREKKFMTDAISSSSFAFFDEPKKESKYQQEFSNTATSNSNNEPQVEKPSVEVQSTSNKNNKKPSKGLKLTKRKGFQ